MATVAAHAAQANHNQNFLESIDAGLFPDWVITAAFYKAVHIVEGLLVRKGLASGSHARRNETIKRRFPDVWYEYRPLYNQSRIVRYNCVNILTSDVAQALARLEAVERVVAATP